MMLGIHITGNIGLYYVYYQLSLKGWNVMPTARNARGIDIIAYNETGSKFVGIQVKTLTKKDAVPLGNSLNKIMGDFWIIVNNIAADKPNIFILLPSEVKKYASSSGKDNNVSYWLSAREYCKDESRDKWERIEEKLNNCPKSPLP